MSSDVSPGEEQSKERSPARESRDMSKSKSQTNRHSSRGDKSASCLSPMAVVSHSQKVSWNSFISRGAGCLALC